MKNNQLFTEISAEEAANINGGGWGSWKKFFKKAAVFVSRAVVLGLIKP